MTYDLSVVIPVRDEEPNLRELVARLREALDEPGLGFEIIFVTDVNRDNTFGLLKELNREDPRVKVIRLTYPFGQHVAVRAGLESCSGEAVVIMDGDLQDFPEDVPKLWHKLSEGYDVVYGTKVRKDDNVFRNLASKFFVSVMNRLSDVNVEHNTSMFRIISKRMLDEILRFKEVQPSLTFIMSLIGLPSATIPVTSGERKGGMTKYGLFRLVNLAINSLISFSTKPVRVISMVGFCVAALSFAYMCVVVAQRLFFGIDVLGWSTTVFLITFLGGVQLLGMGVIGEYIAKIFLETKHRPLYFIQEKIGDFQDNASILQNGRT